jgi:hypothetical protein
MDAFRKITEYLQAGGEPLEAAGIGKEVPDPNIIDINEPLPGQRRSLVTKRADGNGYVVNPDEFGPNFSKVEGSPDSLKAADADREVFAARLLADREEVVNVYLGQAAKSRFNSPREEQFADVVAVTDDRTLLLGEGKGTDVGHAVDQFTKTGQNETVVNDGYRVGKEVVVVPRLKQIPDVGMSPGPGYRVNADGLLEGYDAQTETWDLAQAHGQPIQVIVRPPI